MSTGKKAYSRCVTSLVWGLMVFMIVVMTFPAYAKSGYPKTQDNLKAYGKTYGEWSARWWQFALSNLSVFDETPESCATGQLAPGNKKVWFLVGSFGSDPVVRECTIPRKKALFFPLVNVISFNFVGDPDPFTVEEKQRIASNGFMVQACTLRSTLDGDSIFIPNSTSFLGKKAVIASVVATQSPLFRCRPMTCSASTSMTRKRSRAGTGSCCRR